MFFTKKYKKLLELMAFLVRSDIKPDIEQIYKRLEYLTDKLRLVEDSNKANALRWAEVVAIPKAGQTWKVSYKGKTYIGFTTYDKVRGLVWFANTPAPEIFVSGHVASELEFIEQL